MSLERIIHGDKTVKAGVSSALRHKDIGRLFVSLCTVILFVIVIDHLSHSCISPFFVRAEDKLSERRFLTGQSLNAKKRLCMGRFQIPQSGVSKGACYSGGQRHTIWRVDARVQQICGVDVARKDTRCFISHPYSVTSLPYSGLYVSTVVQVCIYLLNRGNHEGTVTGARVYFKPPPSLARQEEAQTENDHECYGRRAGTDVPLAIAVFDHLLQSRG